MTDDLDIINSMAQEIRRVDGQHTLGAAALAEALLPEVRKAQAGAVRQALKMVDVDSWDREQLVAYADELDPDINPAPTD